MTRRDRLEAFASLRWYDATLHFLFTFVTRTSELLLAAGIVVSTANFLMDGTVMQQHHLLSEIWVWAQALAIDSSLGVVFLTGFHAVKEREPVKAVLFFTLAALLALVAGLITHFDALSHASGLPVTDSRVSGVIPLWVMTALRAIAVIGVLLTSRLRDLSFRDLLFHPEAVVPPIKATPHVCVTEADLLPLPLGFEIKQTSFTKPGESEATPGLLLTSKNREDVSSPPKIQLLGSATTPDPLPSPESEPQQQKPSPTSGTLESRELQENLERASQELHAQGKPISARALAARAHIRRSTCASWLAHQHQTMTEGSSAQGADPT